MIKALCGAAMIVIFGLMWLMLRFDGWEEEE